MSHLFFADDLMLFGEASLENMVAMKVILDEFFLFSGHKVNSRKFQLYFSTKTDEVIRRRNGVALGFQQTEDLGAYFHYSISELRIVPFNSLLIKSNEN